MNRSDTAIASALVLATMLYLAALPRYPGGADEGYFVYESSRLLAGQRLYRDMFEIITPAAFYAQAALFALFGTTMGTARVTFAVLHGLVGAAGFLACRLVGVRRGLALAAALVHVAICAPVWPYASPHWVSTLGTLVLMLLLLARPGGAFLPGIVAGLLIGVQQQRAAAVVVAAALVVLWDGRAGARALVRFVAGVAVVLVPLLGLVTLAAGLDPVVRGLVVFPFVNYRAANRVAWGYLPPFPELFAFTFPTALRVLPVVVLVTAARAVFAARDPGERRALVVLTAIGAGAVGSIAYFPDVIHLAFVAPVFVVLAAEILRRQPRIPIAARAIATALVVAAVAYHLGGTFAAIRRAYPVRHATRFGQIDFPSESEARVVDAVRAITQGTSFVYPGFATLYLMTGTTNPTPYQLMMPGYSGVEQLYDTVEILAAQRVPCVVLVRPFLRPGDPVAAYVEAHYDRVEESANHVAVYRRR